MKTLRNLTILAIVLFGISHVLPAYVSSSGFACFQFCWNMLLGNDGDVFSGGWTYYSAFAISNFLFIGLAVALFVTKKGHWLRSILAAASFLHVLSWLAINTFQRPSQIAEVKIGYYIWLIAYGLLVAAHLRREPGESLESIPVARPAI